MSQDAVETGQDPDRRLRLAVEAGRMAIWDYDAGTDTIAGTEDLNRLLGFPAGQTLDLDHIRARYYPGDGDRIRRESQATLARGERFLQSEYRYRWDDGSLRWHLMRAEVLFDEAGHPSKVIGIVMDITDRKRAEEALAERERELRAALQAASLGSYSYDHAAGRMKASERLGEIYGFPADHDLTLDDMRGRFHPGDLDRIERMFAGAADPAEQQFTMEFRLLLPDGTVRWIQGRGEYVRDEEGRPLVSRGIVVDISDRKHWEEHQRLLVNELNHRVKNSLATVQAIAAQTFRNPDAYDEARRQFSRRLVALGSAHDLLTETNWAGASLRQVVDQAVGPFAQDDRHAFTVDGPPAELTPKVALSLSMALHELCTNAAKYGALSTDRGMVHVDWTIEEGKGEEGKGEEGKGEERKGERRLRLRWRESGGPPVVPPVRKGFGSRLIERGLAAELDGEVRMIYEPDGVLCTIDAPLPAIA